MKSNPAPAHIQGLEENIAEVKRLLKIHQEKAGSKPGYKHNLEVLNKSGVVLLVACWEAFIEDLASMAFEFILKNAQSHSVFTDNVLTLASKELKTSLDQREVWKLAGDGWKKVLKNYKQQLFKRHITTLNTPKPDQIDALFENLIGLKKLSARWHWRGISAGDARKKLVKIVELRGNVAHRVATSSKVHKSHVVDSMKFFYCLAVISSNRVRAYINARTGKKPWQSYQYGKTR